MFAKSYYNRFEVGAAEINFPTAPDLGLVVVIPCFNEPDVTRCLDALWNCARPSCSVEIIVVVNSSESATDADLAANAKSVHEIESWKSTRADGKLQVHCLHHPKLPAKHAGVGFARKIGMDQAAMRLDRVNRPDGIIACFDADCLCDPNYLVELERHFLNHPNTPGCSIYFEHPLEGELPREIYQAITLYELHLRYYVQGLKHCQFPFAFHTVGSCMAVRNSVYQRQGGMNRRKAGEDFYFLHKIIPLGGFTALITTRVIPSPRVSQRVPFGTGKAVRDFLQEGKLWTYPLQAFADLKLWLTQIQPLSQGAAWDQLAMPEPIRTFLLMHDFAAALDEMRANTSTESNFQRRFYQWWNGFRIMKFIHHARDHYYGSSAVEEAARALLHQLDRPVQTYQARDLLDAFRQLDRQTARIT